MADVLVAQISDPHIRSDELAEDADRALAAAVARVLELDPAPDAVILSGDITNDGTAEQYGRAREILAPLRAPVHPLPGNHDERDALREAWADHPGVANASDHLGYALNVGDIRLVVCDTLDTKRDWDGGALGPARLDWLAGALADRPDTPTLVAIHHPPVLSGIPGFDEIGLEADDRAAFARLIEDSPQVGLIACGHVHRVFAARLGRAVVLSAPSVHLQSELHLTPGVDIELVPDPPGISLHLHRKEQGFASHIEPIG